MTEPPPKQAPAMTLTAAGAQGLTSSEARALLAEVGPNEIASEEKTSPLRMLAGQFRGALVWVLIGATALSAALGEVRDAIAIGVILVINAVIGFVPRGAAVTADVSTLRHQRCMARGTREQLADCGEVGGLRHRNSR